MKACKKCRRPLPDSAFYKQPNNTDGLFGNCKECTIDEIMANQRAKRDQYRSYEALRFQQPSRKAKKRHHRERHGQKVGA